MFRRSSPAFNMRNNIVICVIIGLLGLQTISAWVYEMSSINKFRMITNCPNVKAARNFDLNSMMGFWYVVQYYASSEELPEYACMRSLFSINDEHHHVTMNFTYVYDEDPVREQLKGNLTWVIPDLEVPAHWIHTEDTYEGIYNTYIIDTDYKSWSLIMHCAEKSKSPRYLSSLLLSREPILGENVINFLREKLPKYDIDLSFMFPINQENCDESELQSFVDPKKGRGNKRTRRAKNKKPNNKRRHKPTRSPYY